MARLGPDRSAPHRRTGLAHPGPARPGPASPGSARPSQPRLSQAQPAPDRPGPASPGSVRPRQLRPGQTSTRAHGPEVSVARPVRSLHTCLTRAHSHFYFASCAFGIMALLAPRLDPQRAGVPRLQGKSAGASATSGWERGRPDLPPTPKRGGRDPTLAKCGGPRALGLTPRARQTRRLYELSPSQPQPECTCGMTLIGWPGHVDGYCHVERRRSWTGIKLMRQRAGGRALHKPPSGTFDPEESFHTHTSTGICSALGTRWPPR